MKFSEIIDSTMPKLKPVTLPIASKITREIVEKMGYKYISTINPDATGKYGYGYPVGEIRRLKPLIKAVEILLVSKPIKFSDIKAIGGTILPSFVKPDKLVFTYQSTMFENIKVLVILYVVTALAEFGIKAFYATGSSDFIDRFSEYISSRKNLQLKINGLYQDNNLITSGATERMIFSKTGISWVVPSSRNR